MSLILFSKPAQNVLLLCTTYFRTVQVLLGFADSQVGLGRVAKHFHVHQVALGHLLDDVAPDLRVVVDHDRSGIASPAFAPVVSGSAISSHARLFQNVVLFGRPFLAVQLEYGVVGYDTRRARSPAKNI